MIEWLRGINPDSMVFYIILIIAILRMGKGSPQQPLEPSILSALKARLASTSTSNRKKK